MIDKWCEACPLSGRWMCCQTETQVEECKHFSEEMKELEDSELPAKDEEND